MSDHIWDELGILTAKIERLSGERSIARLIGNQLSRHEFQAEIALLLERRKRLIEKLSERLAAPKTSISFAA